MFDTLDGFYTPVPTELPRNGRWPWIVVTVGAVIVVAGGVALSGSQGEHGAADHAAPPGTTASVTTAR